MIAGAAGLRSELFRGRLGAAADRGGGRRAAGGCGGAGAIVPRCRVGGLVERGGLGGRSLGRGRRGGGLSGAMRRRQRVFRTRTPSRAAFAAGGCRISLAQEILPIAFSSRPYGGLIIDVLKFHLDSRGITYLCRISRTLIFA